MKVKSLITKSNKMGIEPNEDDYDDLRNAGVEMQIDKW